MATNLTRRGANANDAALLPALPAAPRSLDPELRSWLERVREYLEVRLGARGDRFERAVTFRDLRAQLDEFATVIESRSDASVTAAEMADLVAQLRAVRAQIAQINRTLVLNFDQSRTQIIRLGSQLRGVAVEDVAVFAVDMRPTQTGGCDPITTIEFGANQPNFHALLFPPGEDTSCDFHTMLPFSWAGKVFTVSLYWGHGDGASSYGVTWEVVANTTYDDESVILDFVGGILADDTGGTAGNLYIAQSGPVPIGSYENEEGSLVSLRVFRRGASSDTDTLDVDAALLAVRFTLTDVPVVAPPGAVEFTVFFGENANPGEAVTGDPVAARAEFMGYLSGAASEGFEAFTVDLEELQGVSVTQNGATCVVNQLMTAENETFTDVVETELVGAIIANDTSAQRFNTTGGGSKWLDLRVQTGYDASAPSGLWIDRWRAKFTFSTPISALGFYGTDFGDFVTANRILIDLTDEDDVVTTHEITDAAARAGGNLIFWGFVDGTKGYTKAVIYIPQEDGESPGEGLGIDDLVFCTAAGLA